MAQTKLLKSLGLPSTRAKFLAEFDGDTNAMAGLQQAFESIAEKNPEAYALWEAAARDATGMEDLVPGLADLLYGAGKPEPVGVRGKVDTPPERIEGNMPTVESAGDKAALPEPPKNAEAPKARVTISPAARAHAAKLGVDLAQVKGTGKNGAVTKADIDAFKSGGAEAPKPAGAAPQAAAAAATPASKPAAQPEPPDPNEPLPGMMGITQADIDGNDSYEPVPGTYGLLTRGDVAQYLDPYGALNEPQPMPEPPKSAMDMSRLSAGNLPPLPPPGPAPVMDMSRLNAANFPPPSPAPQPAPRQSAMDMSRLNSANFPPPAVDIGDLDTSWMQPRTDPTKLDLTDLFGPGDGKSSVGGGEPTQPTAPPKKPPFQPVTSMSDAFFRAMGSQSNLGDGMHYVTKPVDFALKYAAPAAAAGALGYGGYQGVRALVNSMAPAEPNVSPYTEEDMRMLEQKTDAARAAFEQAFGEMGSPERPGRMPAKQPPQQ